MTHVPAVPMVEAQIEEASQMLAQTLHEDPFQKYVLPKEAERAALLPDGQFRGRQFHRRRRGE